MKIYLWEGNWQILGLRLHEFKNFRHLKELEREEDAIEKGRGVRRQGLYLSIEFFFFLLLLLKWIRVMLERRE